MYVIVQSTGRDLAKSTIDSSEIVQTEHTEENRDRGYYMGCVQHHLQTEHIMVLYIASHPSNLVWRPVIRKLKTQARWFTWIKD